MIKAFYEKLSPYYHLLFNDWEEELFQQALLLEGLLMTVCNLRQCFILDCACGIGTQTIGFAELGYLIVGSDSCQEALERARKEAQKRGLSLKFYQADFRGLSEVFNQKFDLIMAMDNALASMLTKVDFDEAIRSISRQLTQKGIFIGSIRDYDALFKAKIRSPKPSMIQSENGKRIAFQIWDWEGACYNFSQYIIEEDLSIHKFEGRNRAIQRSEFNEVLLKNGFQTIAWKMPEETGFYEPIVIAQK